MLRSHLARYLSHSVRQLSSMPQDRPPFKITFTTLDDPVPVTRSFFSMDTFIARFPHHQFIDTQTNVAYRAKEVPYSHTGETVYQAESPADRARQKGLTHNQTSDKAYEDRALKRLEPVVTAIRGVRRQTTHDPDRLDGWRFLTGSDAQDIAEWEGVWVGPTGHYYFLEAKHSMDMTKLHEINKKLKRSLAFLSISRKKATLYVASNYWADAASAFSVAHSYNFGILQNNGSDIDVYKPGTTSPL